MPKRYTPVSAADDVEAVRGCSKAGGSRVLFHLFGGKVMRRILSVPFRTLARKCWGNNSKAWKRMASSIVWRILRFPPKWSTG